MTTNRITKKRKKREAQLSLWAKLPQWVWEQGLRSGIDWTRNPDSRTSNREVTPPAIQMDIKQAEVITSRVEYPQDTGCHRPVLDIDFPCAVLPSTTPGHHHLYLDKELSWEKYQALLHALADAGIIEDGYRWASIARGYTSVRLPWVKKPAPEALAAAEAPATPAPAPEAAESALTIDGAIASGVLTVEPNVDWMGTGDLMPPDDQPEVELVDREAGIEAPALHPNSRSFRNSWDSPNADPLGDILRARDQIINAPYPVGRTPNLAPNPAPIRQEFGVTPAGPYFDGGVYTSSPRIGRLPEPWPPRSRAEEQFSITYDAMHMRYRDNRGRTLTAHDVRRACLELGIDENELSGPGMESVFTRMYRYSVDRENSPRPRMQGARPTAVIVDEAARLHDTEISPEDAALAAVEESLAEANGEEPTPEETSRMRRTSMWSRLADMMVPPTAARAAAQLEDQMARESILRTAPREAPLTVTYTPDSV